jgi:integrase
MGQQPKPLNPNHPVKGSNITVQPIRELKDIHSISKLLSNNPRNQLLFVLGINNGLRTGDLLKLKVKDVVGLKPGDWINIKEGKTGKQNVLAMHKDVRKVLTKYLSTAQLTEGDYLFKSRKGNQPLSIQAVNNYVKKWTQSINLKGNYGAHTLRKTWGYQQRKHFGVGFEIICKRFNHQNPSVTMRYLGITDKEVMDCLSNNEIC